MTKGKRRLVREVVHYLQKTATLIMAIAGVIRAIDEMVPERIEQ